MSIKETSSLNRLVTINKINYTLKKVKRKSPLLYIIIPK